MTVNFKLGESSELEPGCPMARTWAGWDPSCTDEELWEQNRGVWPLSDSSLEGETIASLSFDGRIRVVARIAGKQKFFVEDAKSGYKTALTGATLPVGDPIRDELVGMLVPSTRNPVQYLEDVSPKLGKQVTDRGPKTFLMTFNPESGSKGGVRSTHGIPILAPGSIYRDRWSTGNTTKKIRPGDRAFLLQQGKRSPGIIASGIIESHVFQDMSWNDVTTDANYVYIRWDAVVDESEVLSLEELRKLTPKFPSPNASGTELPIELAEGVEDLWIKRTSTDNNNAPTRPGFGQNWSADPLKRKLAENFGQRILESHYLGQGWEVKDTRAGHPYDAVATKGGETLYLEAKATQSAGESLLVTPNEVTFARAHRGQCVIGVVSDIRFNIDGTLDESSGNFQIYDWTAHESELAATGFKWKPSKPPIIPSRPTQQGQ